MTKQTDMIDAIDASGHDSWLTGSDSVADTADLWLDAGFTATDAPDWWACGAFDATRAAELRDGGIDPTTIRHMVGYDGEWPTVAEVGYLHSNGDMSLDDVRRLAGDPR